MKKFTEKEIKKEKFSPQEKIKNDINELVDNYLTTNDENSEIINKDNLIENLSKITENKIIDSKIEELKKIQDKIFEYDGYDYEDDEDYEEEIEQNYNVGDIVKIDPENDNDNYDEFRNMKLEIIHVAKSIEDHPGYDSGIGEALYDLIVFDTKDLVPFSLYDYELKSV